LVAASNGALVIDGYTVALNDRLLINNQAAALQNGVYKQTSLGSGGGPYTLTRATDFNTVLAINNAGVIPVINGSVNAGTTWALAASIATIGTSPINYTQTNGSQVGPLHALGATFSGGGVQAPQVYCCVVAVNAGIIKSWDITVDDGTGAGTCSACTCTVKFLRVATGTTTPSTSNSINTSGVALSTGTSLSSTTLSDFTSIVVAAGDRFGVQLSAVANAVVVMADFQYQ
jgi:hypothetical protein